MNAAVIAVGLGVGFALLAGILALQVRYAQKHGVVRDRGGGLAKPTSAGKLLRRTRDTEAFTARVTAMKAGVVAFLGVTVLAFAYALYLMIVTA